MAGLYLIGSHKPSVADDEARLAFEASHDRTLRVTNTGSKVLLAGTIEGDLASVHPGERIDIHLGAAAGELIVDVEGPDRTGASVHIAECRHVS